MSLIEYVDEQCIELDCEFSNWKEAILFAGKLLENNGFINHKYSSDMVELVEKCGAYIVVMPGVAMCHARPNGNVNKKSISIVRLSTGIEFGHPVNDPVKLIFAIAAVNDEEHLKLFQAVANHLMIEGNLEELMNCKNKKEMIKEIIENE